MTITLYKSHSNPIYFNLFLIPLQLTPETYPVRIASKSYRTAFSIQTTIFSNLILNPNIFSTILNQYRIQFHHHSIHILKYSISYSTQPKPNLFNMQPILSKKKSVSFSLHQLARESASGILVEWCVNDCIDRRRLAFSVCCGFHFPTKEGVEMAKGFLGTPRG